ncbi:MAG: hypothetical protein AAF203_06005 [Pseudomonadota bacterium]
MIVIPGFGANKDSGTASFLTELILKNTDDDTPIVTLASNSPAAAEFVAHSHSSGIPGNQKADAENLYKMILASIAHLEDRRGYYGFNIVKVSLIGASLGSMNVTHLMALDLKKKEQLQKQNGEENPKRSLSQSYIKFDKIFALNPPISNVYGSTIIDTLVKESWAASTKLGAKAIFDAVKKLLPRKLDANIFNNPKNIATWFEKYLTSVKEKNFTLSQLRYLVGFGFAPIVQKAIKAGKKRGAIPADDSTKIPFTRYLLKYTYTHYAPGNFVENIGLSEVANYFGYGPVFEFDPDSETEVLVENQNYAYAMTEMESLHVLVPQLQNEGHDLSHYHLITFKDDFLLRAEDPAWIRSNLPGRMGSTSTKGNSIVFEKGGHLGGYTQREFQRYLFSHIDE